MMLILFVVGLIIRKKLSKPINYNDNPEVILILATPGNAYKSI